MPVNTKRLRVLCASVMIIMVTAIAAPCHGEESTQTDPTDNAAQQAIKKARTLGEHATQSSPEDRAVLWHQAHDACAEFLAAHPQDPRRL